VVRAGLSECRSLVCSYVWPVALIGMRAVGSRSALAPTAGLLALRSVASSSPRQSARSITSARSHSTTVSATVQPARDSVPDSIIRVGPPTDAMGSKSRASSSTSRDGGWSRTAIAVIGILVIGALAWSILGFQPSFEGPGGVNPYAVHPPTTHTSPSTGLRFTSALHDPSAIADLRWGIIFDAGSTGSRVHIYRFRVSSVSGVAPVLEDEIFVEVKPGLSAYVPRGVGADAGSRDVGQTSAAEQRKMGPAAAAASLKPLLDLCLEQIPASSHASTPISLRATAGLRLLGEQTAAEILSAIRSEFGRYPFPFLPTDVEVMGGSEEGVFAWITVNYLLQHLSDTATTNETEREHPATSAILDLGGASTQIVFEPTASAVQSLPAGERAALYTLPYGQREYNLFETSYLGYGLMEARRRVKEAILSHTNLAVHTAEGGNQQREVVDDESLPLYYHPCLSDTHSEMITGPDAEGKSTRALLRGHAQGHTSCSSVVRLLFPKHPSHPCTSSSCSFGGHFALPLTRHAEGALKDPRRGRIYAFSYFYDRTLEIFELEEETVHQQATADGTVLKVGRLKELADTICAFSMRQHRVKTLAELELERDQEMQRRVAEAHQKGCKQVNIKGQDGSVQTRTTTPPPPQRTVDPSEEECLIEEKPDLSASHEAAHSRISSPFVGLLSENPYLCLDLTYAHTLLHHGYDLADSTDLHIMKRLQKKEIGWCLGAMLSQMAQRGW
jgi:Golgi nucleoside diphosphatase